MHRSTRSWSAAVLTSILPAISAHADISGFGTLNAAQWSVNVADGASAPTYDVGTGTLHLTNQAAGESRSIFYNARQGITQFQASFTFRATGTPTNEFGACFVLQNSGGGSHTVAAPLVSGIGTRFGYSDFFGSFGNSIAVSLQSGSLGGGSSSTAAYMNGGVGGSSQSTSPLNLFSGNPIAVTLTYNGSLLQEHAVDTVTLAQFDTTYILNIASTVGNSLAYVGLTAASQANVSTDQYFSNFQFSSVPAPAAGPLLVIGASAFGRRRR